MYNDGHGNSSTQIQSVVVSVPVATTGYWRNAIELMSVESGIYFVSATDLNGHTSVKRISVVR